MLRGDLALHSCSAAARTVAVLCGVCVCVCVPLTQVSALSSFNVLALSSLNTLWTYKLLARAHKEKLL